jgi:hypothetical protein
VITTAPRTPLDAWLTAVTLGGQGRYAAAGALLRTLMSDHDSDHDPVIAALACATRASHLRQLGGHAAARALDGTGLRRLAAAGLVVSAAPTHDHHRPRRPVGADLEAARSDVLLGLAADAIGLGRTAEARKLFGIESASGNAGWRAEIRRGWVAAEIELGAGSPEAAVEPATAASAAATRSGSVRHQVKSALVLGAAMAAVGERSNARKLILDAHSDATRLGLIPLVWPCAMVLADLEQDSADGHRRAAARALHCVLRRADPIARSLAEASPWVPTWLFSG